MSIQQSEAASAPAAPAATTGFRDPTTLTRWLKLLLYLGIVLSALSLLSGILQLNMLQEVQAGRTLTPGEADSNDAREQLIAGVKFLQIIVTIFFFSIWIYRANYNARQLGAVGMTFSPGWAVGWYFVPVANLWKPYQAMSEIWRASADPAHWQELPTGSNLPLWWALFLLSNLASNASFRLTLRAKTVSDWVFATTVSAANDALDIAATVVAIVLVREIYRMQMTRRAAEAFS